MRKEGKARDEKKSQERGMRKRKARKEAGKKIKA
jgi:hypothetical protein